MFAKGDYLKDACGTLYKVIDVMHDKYILYCKDGVKTALFNIAHRRLTKI
jgi:hypothetical protein